MATKNTLAGFREVFLKLNRMSTFLGKKQVLNVTQKSEGLRNEKFWSLPNDKFNR